MPSPARTVPFLLRFSVEERQLLEKAAELDGIKLGTWLRSVAIREARTKLKALGVRPES